MEKNLNKNELRLQELMEKKSFDQLSADEQAFVLSQTTQEAYELQYKLIQESTQLEEEVEPRPLIVPKKPKRGVVNSIVSSGCRSCRGDRYFILHFQVRNYYCRAG